MQAVHSVRLFNGAERPDEVVWNPLQIARNEDKRNSLGGEVAAYIDSGRAIAQLDIDESEFRHGIIDKLDGFCKVACHTNDLVTVCLNLAFEFQGEQHFVFHNQCSQNHSFLAFNRQRNADLGPMTLDVPLDLGSKLSQGGIEHGLTERALLVIHLDGCDRIDNAYQEVPI